MPPKVAWVLLPLTAYALYVAVCALRGRLPSRLALNVQTSILLMLYLLTTASLGIFWVANQQLPVFDIHYLFGYATLLLLSIHLTFNFPAVLRWLRLPPAATAGQDRAGGALALGKAAAIVAGMAAVFFLGTRQSTTAPSFQGVAGAPAQRPRDVVLRFHEFSSESRASVFRRAPGVEWGTPPPEFKRYPGARRIALERGSIGPLALSEAFRAPAPGAGSLKLGQLGKVLYLTAGVTARRGGNALRAAPSSGALFPTEVYLLARRIDGIAPGIYHYDPEGHQLHALGPSAGDGVAEATIVLASVFRRTGYKYRDRAYRYAVADAGHLLENLRVAGHDAGMHMLPLARFDEGQVAKTLGIDAIEEGVLAMVDMASRPDAEGPPRARHVAAPAALGQALGATAMIHQATSLSESVDGTAGDLVPLPQAVPATSGVHETIVQRRSKRRFLDQPVALGALSSMLADMAGPALLSDAIRINIVVNRVAGLAPGVYRYHRRHALERVRSGDFAAAAQSAALSQEVIGGAAAVLVLSADRAALLADGPRGYRHGFLEAGMVGERWLLGAVARGLAACPVGAFYDDEAAALIGVDPRQEWVLHFAALGTTAE